MSTVTPSVETRFIPYYRVSTKRQGQSGLGLEAQRVDVSKLIVERDGCEIAHYIEIETGKNPDRPELAKAVAHAKLANATLVVAKLDRLARNVAFTAALMESGVPFICCDCKEANRFTIHILAAVAEEEARKISERTKKALAAAKARGVKLGSQAAWPLDRQTKRMGGGTGQVHHGSATTDGASLCERVAHDEAAAGRRQDGG